MTHPSRVGNFMKHLIHAYRIIHVAVGLVIVITGAASGQERSAAINSPTAYYVIGRDDQISVRISDGVQASENSYLISANGDITVPLIGRVHAAGLSAEQLETDLQGKLRMYIRNPQVSVEVKEFRSQPVSVLGAVTTPGIFQLRGHKTLYEAVSMAGGPNENAGRTLTLSRRKESGGIEFPGVVADPSGEFTSVHLKLAEILTAQSFAATIEIKPYDVITISPANAIQIYVVGDVQHPGAFAVGASQTISVARAISLAGGLGRTARPEGAKVFRNDSGAASPLEVAVNIKKVLGGTTEDMLLKPDDVLVVPTSSRKAFTATTVPATIASAVAAAIYAGTRY